MFSPSLGRPSGDSQLAASSSAAADLKCLQCLTEFSDYTFLFDFLGWYGGKWEGLEAAERRPLSVKDETCSDVDW